MQLQINRDSKTPIYIQIKKQISDMIMSEALPPNYILPPERSLSEKLQVNRSTVIKAYMELKAEGLVESRVGSGTVVLAQLSSKEVDEKMYVPPLRWNQIESRNFTKNTGQIINRILAALEKENIISFASGISSEDNYNLDSMKMLHMELFDKYKEKLFMPTPVDGCIEAKTAIKSYIKEKGINSNLKQIMITSGSQQSIEFFTRLIVEPGDVVIVEEPSYPGAIQAFDSYGAKIIAIPMDEQGIKLDILETCLIKYRPKFIYTQPSFHNPTGITMSLERRKELLQLAYFYQVPILEDDPYGDLRFEGDTLPTLKALDEHDYVIYISSFSKTISFSLRIGYVVAPENIINHFIRFKQLTDIQTNTLAQYLVSEFIQQGYLKKQVELLRSNYKRKRDLMIKELKSNKISGLEVVLPQGGYFIWCKLPDNLRTDELMDNIGALGVLVMSGEVFYPNTSIGQNYMRLNYSYPSEEEIVEGVKRLVKAIKLCSKIVRNNKVFINSSINPFL